MEEVEVQEGGGEGCKIHEGVGRGDGAVWVSQVEEAAILAGVCKVCRYEDDDEEVE